MDFEKSIYENKQRLGRPFLAAHRGICGANVPCNTMLAFQIAVEQGADIVEIDVAKSKDGKFFVFHPKMEPVFLKSEKLIAEMTADEVSQLFLYNQDDVITHYKVPTLEEVLTYLKGKVYINVDKFWTDVEGISKVIRKVGVERQVIVKTFTDEESLDSVVKYASDFMFMPLIKKKDEVTDMLREKGVNVIGAEILFESETEDVISDEYIQKMHDKGLLIWANAIIYDERAVISAYHTDDVAMEGNPDKGWGWLINKNVDIIQTDWLWAIKAYINSKII